jgi:hypothetical protein
MRYLIEDNAKIQKVVEEVIESLIDRGYHEDRVRSELVISAILTGIVRGFLVSDFENMKRTIQ